MAFVRYTIYIDEETKRRIVEMANNVGVSANVIVKMAIKEFVNGDEREKVMNYLKGHMHNG